MDDDIPYHTTPGKFAQDKQLIIDEYLDRRLIHAHKMFEITNKRMGDGYSASDFLKVTVSFLNMLDIARGRTTDSNSLENFLFDFLCACASDAIGKHIKARSQERGGPFCDAVDEAGNPAWMSSIRFDEPK